MDPDCRKTGDSAVPRAALAQLLGKFPPYNLQSQEEALIVMTDIEKILSCVAISEDVDGDVPAK